MEKLKVKTAEEYIQSKDLKKTIDYNKKIIDILALKRLKVFNEDGKEVLVSSFWENSKVILIFVRHFSCIACRAHVDKIWRQRESFKKNKTRVIFIGNGKASYIRHFKDQMNVHEAEIYTDPTLQVFDACRMNRSIFKLLSFKSGKSVLRLKKEGYAQGEWKSDTGSHRQMGGVVAIKPPGKVVYHFVANYLGDFDNPNDWPA